MRKRIESWAWEDDLEVLNGWEEADGELEPFYDREHAGRFLRDCLGDTFATQTLRSLYHEEHPASRPPSDDELVDHLAWRLAQGDLQIVRRPRRVVPLPPAPEMAPGPRPKEIKAWIEIVLIDEEDEPVRGINFQLQPLGGGGPRPGGLDQKGFSRTDGLTPGTYKLVFPDLPDLEDL